MKIFRFKRQTALLVLIILLAFVLRFYNLSSNPPGLDWDEASSIYNGYSIAQTGKDEYNKPLPFLFRAFDAYVPPVLIYLDAVSAKLFGLSEFAARFPNAFLGSLSIFGLFLLVKILTQNLKIALISGLILALSPWHITYSRVGTFAPLPIVFIIFGTYFFLRGLSKKLFLIAATLSFSIAVLSYFSAYVFVPMYVVVLVGVYRKQLTKIQIMLLLSVIFGTAILLFTAPGGQVRLRGVSVFSDPDLVKRETLLGAHEWSGRVLHNRRLVYIQQLFVGYFSHYHFDFLFSKADAVTRFIVPGPGFGLMYWWELPMLVIGIFQLLRNRVPGRYIILFWLLLSPLPAAPTLPKPASTRTVLMIPALVMVVAYGIWYCMSRYNKLVFYGISILLGINILLFLHQYFVHFPEEKSVEWFYHYKPLFVFLNEPQNRTKKIIFFIKRPDILDESHIFTVFYNHIEPEQYQTLGGTRTGKFGTTGEFNVGRFIFVPSDCMVCGNGLYTSEDLLVSARQLSAQPVAIFPQNSSPAIFVYNINDFLIKGPIIDKMQ